MTPFEAWTGMMPDLSNLHVFGSKAYVLIPKALRSKFEKRTLELIFVGYSEVSKAWIFFDPNKNTTLRSQDATFGNEIFIRSPLDTPETHQLTHISPTYSRSEQTVEFSSKDIIPIDPAESIYTVSIEGDSEEEEIDLNPPLDRRIEEAPEVSPASIRIPHDRPIASIRMLHNRPIDAAPLHEKRKSTRRIEGYSLFTNINVSPSYSEEMRGPHATEFKTAVLKEYSSLSKNGVFSAPCDLPVGFTAITTKLVLKIKETETAEEPLKFKARLCGRGFLQTYGIDYFQTFAPVANYNSIRCFLTVLASMDFEVDCVDVITAFLHSPLKEEIYITVPEGYPITGQKNKVLRLLKSLYGLKQAPRDWNQQLDAHLKHLGFQPLVTESCIYIGKFELKICYIIVYVDDMLIATMSRSTLANLKVKIHAKFPIEDKGPLSFFLNIHAKRDRKLRTITLFQTVKIEQLLLDMNMSDCVPTKLPADPLVCLKKEMMPTTLLEIEAMQEIPYKSVLGRLQHIAITTRPDIVPAVSAVGSFSHNPGMQHWVAVQRILSYLKGTKTVGLILGGICDELQIEAYADADWAGEMEERKSRTGFVILIGSASIIWCSKLQSSTALSSTESEYLALSSTCQDVIWLRALMKEFGFNQHQPTVIYQDNQSTITIAESDKNYPAIKHVELRYHFIRQKIKSQEVRLVKKATGEMTADIFTKQLPWPAFSRHRASLGLSV